MFASSLQAAISQMQALKEIFKRFHTIVNVATLFVVAWYVAQIAHQCIRVVEVLCAALLLLPPPASPIAGNHTWNSNATLETHHSH